MKQKFGNLNFMKNFSGVFVSTKLSAVKASFLKHATASLPVLGIFGLSLLLNVGVFAQGPIFTGDAGNLSNIIREGLKLMAIVYNETRFRPYLKSPKNAQGLMQFIPSTAARFDLINPYEPVTAIRAAARYVKYLSNLFGGRIDSILAAYNSGEGAVSAYLVGRTIRTERKIINPRSLKTIGGVPPYAETVGYVGRGLKIYRWLVLRGTFPTNLKRAVIPTVISAAVARVSLIDYELGEVRDFIAKTLPQQKVEARDEHVSETFAQNSQKEDEQNSKISSPKVVYYDSRSGNRYAVNNGKQTKLRDDGIIVITNNTRSATTNKARSTFFAAPLK